MTRSRSIAVAQTCPVADDVQANLDEHVRLARLAATEGAKLVVFPELSLTGYELALAARLAFSENDPRLSSLLEVAASQGTTLVVGAPVRVGSVLHIEWKDLQAELVVRGEIIGSPSLEVYGHHCEETSKLETTILICLQTKPI